MRRSICISEPSYTFAGESNTWKFAYTTATNLPKGTRLKFDLLTKGREIDWEVPQTNLKDKENVIWGEMPDEKVVPAQEIEIPDHFTPSFGFTLPSEIKAGDTFTIYMGSSTKTKISANRSQTNVQRRRPFHLYIDPKGKGDFRDPEIFTVDIRGNKLHKIRIFTPSVVSKNRRFDVTVRFEDQFGNLTHNAPENTLIELSYEHLRENFTWKLFVPETGFINLPNLYFNEPGIYRIQLRNLQNNETFFSSPIKCFIDYDKSVYWGLFHGESERVDSTENIEACLRHYRDEKGLNFFATSPFESVEETTNEIWKLISTHIAEFNEDNRFTTFLGFQWAGTTPEEGLRQIIYLKDNKPILRKKDSKSNLLKKIYKSHTPKDLFAIPCFSMGKGTETNFEDFTPEYERVVEIYNAWGSSECTTKEGNLRPILSSGKNGVKESSDGSIRKLLNRNCRVGFTAGGLDDRGSYEKLFSSDQEQYSPGITAIIALEQTRETLAQALMNRSCYATTGERIILGFTIAGAPIGSELSTKSKPGLALNRHITGFVAGTAVVSSIEIIRNGIVHHVIKPNKESFEFTYDDSEHLSKIALASPDDRPSFVYYYLRVIQEDGHIAWASPIWIDYVEPTNEVSATPAAKKSKK